MLFDTHAHLHDEQFDGDRDAALERASQAGVEAIVNVGTDLETSRRAIALAAARGGRGPRLFAAVGFHPYDGDKVDAAAVGALRELAAAPAVVAFGETGFDFFRMRSSREGQERALRAHLDLACECGKTVILHLRSSRNAGPEAADAYDAALRVLDDYAGAGLRLVAHCFSGTPAHARALAARGYHVSFAGNATYPGAGSLREAARAVPLDRLVIETDCPYLAPQARRGKRNEPAFIRMTAETIARERGLSLEELAAAVGANARRLFGITD
jgi:TatD DNase family protein